MLELAAHQECLSTVIAQPGCLGVTWDILSEDKTALVWLVGEQKQQQYMRQSLAKTAT